MTRAASSNSTTFMPIALYSRREAWKMEALAITTTSPAAAAIVNHVPIPVIAGRMSPIAPSISETPNKAHKWGWNNSHPVHIFLEGLNRPERLHKSGQQKCQGQQPLDDPEHDVHLLLS